jgi:hypothetical protein
MLDLQPRPETIRLVYRPLLAHVAHIAALGAAFSPLLPAPRALAANPFPDQKVDPAKFNVCSITINSDDERSAFHDRLGTDKFNYIELTTLNGKSSNPKNWFDRACKSGVSCDVLLISGHSAGGFLEKNGYELTFDELGRHACADDCKGILHDPFEIFFFGCNTLSTTARDQRGPEGYLNVLLEHHFTGRRAMEVVDLRYGSGSIIDATKSYFAGSLHLYGFHSVGPSGEHVRPYLNQYFDSVPDYSSHLSGMEFERIAANIGNLNHSLAPNLELASALSVSHFAQCTGTLPGADAEIAYRQTMCTLTSKTVKDTEKLKLVQDLTEAGAFGKFQYYIHHFLRERMPALAKKPDSLASLRSNLPAEAMFRERLRGNDSPSIRAEWADLGYRVGWLSRSELSEYQTDLVKHMITQEPWQEGTARLICEHIARVPGTLKLKPEDIPPGMSSLPEGRKVAQCLRGTRRK